MVIFSSNTSYFSLYNYGLGHPTLCVNLSDSSGLDHSLGSRVIAVFSKRRCLYSIMVKLYKPQQLNIRSTVYTSAVSLANLS